MAKNLLIVESPAKAKTIEGYLGADFTVKSSYGHIRDLPSRQIGIDEANNFAPQYVILPKAKKVIPGLKEAVKNADKVYLATDFDREGEAIAWHLIAQLRLKRFVRVSYTQITDSAVKAAIAKPRSLDLPLIEAQRARQCLDKLVGYEVSPLLWNSSGGKSAGRVQSATLHLICERERERQACSSSLWKS